MKLEFKNKIRNGFKTKYKFDIRTKIFLFFSLFALIILGLIWLMQVILLEKTYNNQQKYEIITAAENVKSKLNDDDIDEYIKNLSYGNALNVFVLNKDGMVILPDSVTGRYIKVELFMLLKNQLDNSGKEKSIYKIMNNVLIYGERLTYNDEEIYIYVDSPLESVNQTIKVLRMQLFIITIIVILLSAVLSFVFSNNISRPVVKMSKQAKRLAKRDFGFSFDGSNYKEINDLASTLNYAKNELQKTDNLQKQLIANVSHDLKTPLTMIKAYAEMIRDLYGDDKEKRIKSTNIIINESDRLAELVNDILNISKAGTNLDNFSKNRENLSVITEAITEKFGVLEQLESYKFVKNIQNDIFVLCNKEKIQQVIYNLVANAVNYTGANKTVYINLKAENNTARLEIIDTGKGIPEKIKADIWDRYYRSENTHKRPVQGTGLGLSIVKSILLAHNFKFGVDSSEGKGSCFYIEFPLNIDFN